MALRPRTKLIHVGPYTFRQKVRNPTAAEKADNKAGKLYYRKNKTKIRLANKKRNNLVNKSPKLRKERSIKQAAQKLRQDGKSPSAAISIAKKRYALRQQLDNTK